MLAVVQRHMPASQCEMIRGLSSGLGGPKNLLALILDDHEVSVRLELGLELTVSRDQVLVCVKGLVLL